MSAEAPRKILIVGESLTGKTALIRTFLDYENDKDIYKQRKSECATSSSTNAVTA